MTSSSYAVDVPTPIPGSRYISSQIDGSSWTAYYIVSVVAPLTQPFTQPESCRHVVKDMGADSASYGRNAFTYGGRCAINSVKTDTDSACYPPWDTPALTTTTASTTQLNVFQSTTIMYSPATGCPAGFAVACTIAGYYGPLSAQEEALICCPQGFECGNSSRCFSTHTSTTIVATYCGTEPTLSTFIAGTDAPTTYVPTVLVANPVAIVRSPKARETSSGLSSPLQAAIGVSVSLGVIFLTLVGYLLYRYHKKKSRHQTVDSSMTDVELDGGTTHELHEKSKATDLEADAEDTERQVYELPETCVAEAPEDAHAPAELDIQHDELEVPTKAS